MWHRTVHPAARCRLSLVCLAAALLSDGIPRGGAVFAQVPGASEPGTSGLRTRAEIAAATFVNLDFDRFPVLPDWKMPSEGAIFVATTGDDRGSGRRDSPFRSLAHAVRVASPGSTIVVRAGTYEEVWATGDNRALVLEIDNLTLMAAPGETVTLRPAPGVDYGLTVNASHLVVRGFRLEGFATVGILFEPGRVRNRDIVLANVEITGSAEAIAMWEAAGSVDGLLLVDVSTDAIIHCGTGPCSSWRLERVVIDAGGGSGWGADAFAVEAGDNILIVDATIRGAASDGIDIKATRVVVLDSRIRGVANNAIKLWHGGDVINTLVWRGWQPPVWVEEGRFRFLHSVIAYSAAVAGHRGYSLVCGYDRRRPMKIEIVDSIIANPSGGVWINPETSSLAVRNTLFFTADGSEILIHGDFEAAFGKRGIGKLNRRYGSGSLAADPGLKRNLRPTSVHSSYPRPGLGARPARCKLRQEAG